MGILGLLLGIISLYVLWKLFVFIIKIINWVSSYSRPGGSSYNTPPGVSPFYAHRRYQRDYDKYEKLKAKREEKKRQCDDGLVKRLISDYRDMYK